jgi:hypothetical protein
LGRHQHRHPNDLALDTDTVSVGQTLAKIAQALGSASHQYEIVATFGKAAGEYGADPGRGAGNEGDRSYGWHLSFLTVLLALLESRARSHFSS